MLNFDKVRLYAMSNFDKYLQASRYLFPKAPFALFLFDFSQYAAGVADGDDSGGDVARDDRACSYRAVAADADSGENGDIPAEPDIVSDGDGFRPFYVLIAPRGVKRMYGGIETAIRTDVDMVSESDLGFIEDYQIVIGEKEFSHFYIAPVIAMERSVDVQRLAGASQKPAQPFIYFRAPHRRQGIYLETLLLAAKYLLLEALVCGVVPLSAVYGLFDVRHI